MPAPVSESTIHALRALIDDGRYREGDRIPTERELAERLGRSRATVREAIRQLVVSGLLKPRHGSGTFVAGVDLDALFEVRLRLEPYAAGLAATRRSAAQARELVALVRGLRPLLDDPAAFASLDADIHVHIALLADNAILLDTLGRLGRLAAVSRIYTVSDRAVRRRTVDQMTALGRAISARDAVAAECAMEEHLVSLRRIAAA